MIVTVSHTTPQPNTTTSMFLITKTANYYAKPCNSKVKRLHHLHSSTHTHWTRRHIETLFRFSWWRREESRSCWGKVVGEHLKDKGKTKEELAKTLWDDNLTAIADVCLPFLLIFSLIDDVHSYAMIASKNMSSFTRTRKPDFIYTVSITPQGIHYPPSCHNRRIRLHMVVYKNTIYRPWHYPKSESVYETGIWNGEVIEWFVVRTEYPFGVARKMLRPFNALFQNQIRRALHDVDWRKRRFKEALFNPLYTRTTLIFKKTIKL